MRYLSVPAEVSVAEMQANGVSLSPGMYRRVTIPTSQVKTIQDLLSPTQPFDKGTEPGSRWYLRQSPNHLIRTKALQDHSWLLYPKGGAITPVNPRVFVDPQLTDGDILMSKDSNVGECAIVDGDGWSGHMFSGGILRLNTIIDRFYFFSFLKHPLFKTQLLAKVPRGATIAHAKSLWLECLLPFPNQRDASRIIKYVSCLARAIVEKERAIKLRAKAIGQLITTELVTNQKSRTFYFEHPRFADLQTLGRLDAAIYSLEYKSKIWLVENYNRGSLTPKQGGFTVTPGPSLEIKLLKTRLDSDVPKPGFYALIIPTNISEYGTLNRVTYIGTAYKLPLLRQGDILFGEAGFQKGRSVVLIDGVEKCTTNAHGLYARRADGDIAKSVFFRCVFDWYRSMRLIDLMAVGGSGGHFSPEYFEYLRIPRLPDTLKADIVKLYHNNAAKPEGTPTPANFVSWHDQWNQELGIWELDREMKALQRTLLGVQERIIEGKAVSLRVADAKQ